MEISQIRELHPLEIKVLRAFEDNTQFSSEDIVQTLALVLGQANQALSWLQQKSLIVEVSRTEEIGYEATSLGKDWVQNGSPSEKLFMLIKDSSVNLQDAAKILHMEAKDLGSAFGQLSKQKILGLDENKHIVLLKDELPKEISTLKTYLLKDGLILEKDLSHDERAILSQHAKKRGATDSPLKRIEREKVYYTLTELGITVAKEAKKLGLRGDEIGQLSPEMLAKGSWKNNTFRPYNVGLPPQRVSLGRRNPYSEFLQQVKDKLVGLGFEEFDGSLVQTEFWNSDALFMPQFHPARDIHDVYFIKNPTHAKNIDEPWLSRVSAAHEHGGDTGSRGWNYTFDKDFTKRLILRSQGTVFSAQTLPKAKIPGKYFGALRVFRRDQVDSTHLSDFYQTEGIILGDDVNIQTLLGLLKVFAEEFAHAEEVKYVPGYFPFTEPSVEVHIKHPNIGWMELGGSGIFRPEVTHTLGVDVPVAAWGIGIDRMATMQMKINDLRDLFTNDLEKVIYRKGVNI